MRSSRTAVVEFFRMIAAPRFVHLRLHSEYSVTDGIVRLDEAYFERQKRLQREVEQARERYSEALRRWNEVR